MFSVWVSVLRKISPYYSFLGLPFNFDLDPLFHFWHPKWDNQVLSTVCHKTCPILTILITSDDACKSWWQWSPRVGCFYLNKITASQNGLVSLLKMQCDQVNFKGIAWIPSEIKELLETSNFLIPKTCMNIKEKQAKSRGGKQFYSYKTCFL